MKVLGLAAVVLLATMTVSCGRSYLVLKAPTTSLAPYGGQWDVPTPIVADHVYNLYPNKMAEWKGKIQGVVGAMQGRMTAWLAKYRPGGTPARVQIDIIDLRPAGFWKGGRMTITATIIDPESEEVLGKCQISMGVGSNYGHQLYPTNGLAQRVTKFILDYSK